MSDKFFREKFLAFLPDQLGFREDAIVSYYMDLCPVQDSFCYRAKRLGLLLANQLISERGELNRERLAWLKDFFAKKAYVLGPKRESDALIHEHIQKCLEKLSDLWPKLQKFSLPLCHKRAEEIIKETLWPESIRVVQTFHVRRAVLAAWFTFLRQSTGSCFATASAILIQKYSPESFFKDLYDLLSMGQMKRTIAGREYAVPLSLSSGKGDLQKGVTTSFVCAPGLITALEIGGDSFEQKVGHLQGLLQKGEAFTSVEKLIRHVLLRHAGLTEEDVRDEEHLARIQMTPLLAKQGIFYQKPSVRAQKVSECKARFVKACLTFQSFTECSLLRSWEYAMASLCDVKTEFSRWNLYIGLGLHPDKNGVGAFLYEKINHQLQLCNQEIERLRMEYEQVMGTIRSIELMFRDASEAARQQLKADLSMRMRTGNTLLEMRDQLIVKAEKIAAFFPSLLEQYDLKLQESFQELFDPSLLGEEAHLYEDSPAGFRLVYKHGRSDASQWTAIYNAEEYINSLRDFFARVENEIQVDTLIGREFVTEVTTALIQHIQEPAFIESAIRRSQEVGRRSPWDYISGGTMQILVQAYCNRDRPLTESKIIPHSAEDLFSFIVKAKKERPQLMHSPTHAFVFYPHLFPANAVAFLEENRQFVKKHKWDELEQEHIAHRLSESLPETERALFLHIFRKRTEAQTKTQFRNNLIESLGAQIKNREMMVDSILYAHTPMFSLTEAEKAIREILRLLNQSSAIELQGSFYGSYELAQIVKMIILNSLQTPFSPVDWDQNISVAMQKLGYSYPHPLLFADTNWSEWFFGFVVSPATEALELWRLNRTAIQGFPMHQWKEYLSLQNTNSWVLLSDPNQYML